MMDNWEEAWVEYYKKVIERLGWAGAILVIIGYYLNAHQLASSWVVWVIGNALVALYSYNKKAYPTAIMSIIILIMNVYGYISWRTT